VTEPRELPAPPVGEEIHLPGPTLLPIATAVGITFAIVGLTIGWWLVAVGVLITVIAIIRWIREAREEIEELPPAH
jgi:hypothetical protein